jgi:hypothetical protein
MQMDTRTAWATLVEMGNLAQQRYDRLKKIYQILTQHPEWAKTCPDPSLSELLSESSMEDSEREYHFDKSA